MTQNNVKIGVVGYGMRLQQVIRALRSATDRVNFLSIYDPSADAVGAFRQELNPQAIVCASVEELVSGEVDWVMIGSWNCQHAEHAVAALNADKHVFCEKPLALTVEDCLRVRDAWQRSGKLFSLGFTLRYSPHYRKIREVVASGRLGRILSLEFNEVLDFNHGGYIHGDWRRKTEWAGSHLLEKCCHDLDLVNWILDSRPLRAASFGGCDYFTATNQSEISRLGQNESGHEAFRVIPQSASRSIPGSAATPFNDDKDIVDNQVAIFEYASGTRATFHTNCLSAIPERRMYLCGTRGTLRADVITGKIEMQEIGFDTATEHLDAGVSGGHGGADEVLGRSLAASMLEGKVPDAGLEEGLSAAFAAFAADEALRTGQVASVPSIASESV